MKSSLLLTLYLCTTFVAFSQNQTFIKLSGGRVSFGSPDVIGYGIGMDFSKKLCKKKTISGNCLLAGAEVIIENGSRTTVFENPSPAESFRSFAHLSALTLWPKFTWYPFGGILKGLNLQLGPTAGYTIRTLQGQSEIRQTPLGGTRRMTTVDFKNGFTAGYRISTGLEFIISKKYLAGVRVDFSNNNEAEVNTFAGLKAGLLF